MLRTLCFPIALVLAVAALGQTNDATLSKSARKARAALDKNEPYRALKLCPGGSSKKTPDPACYALRAEANNRIGEPRKAILDARKGMLFKGPSAIDAQLQLGIAYHAIGMRDSAEHAFRDILDVSTEAGYRYALVLRETNRAAEALYFLNEILTTVQSARYYRERGVTYAMLGDTAVARADLDKAIDLEPKNPVNWNARGFHRYAAFGDHQRAIHDYDQAIKLDKNHGYAFNNRGWSRYKVGEIEAGLRDIRLAGRKNRGNAMVDRNLGMIAFEQGKADVACVDWQTALEKDFTARFGTEVEDLMKQHCGKINPSPAAPKDIQDRNAPKPAPTPRQDRGNAP